MNDFKKTFHFVEIYLFNDILYVVPLTELPPIFVWALVNPVIKLQDFSQEKLALAIDSAKETSKSHFDPAHADPSIKPWDGENHQVSNHATRMWSLLWKEDGSIDIRFEIPDKMYRGDMQWKIISKKTFFPPVSLRDIAQEILRQV